MRGTGREQCGGRLVGVTGVTEDIYTGQGLDIDRELTNCVLVKFLIVFLKRDHTSFVTYIINIYNMKSLLIII